MQRLSPASGKRGRSQTLPDAAIQFCLSIECLFGLPLRQTLGLVQSLLKMAGLPGSTRLQHCVPQAKELRCSGALPQSSGNGLRLLADASGIKFFGRR